MRAAAVLALAIAVFVQAGFAAAAVSDRPAPPDPDASDVSIRLITGPVFWTGNPDQPEAEALAVDQDGRILEVYNVRPRGLPWPEIVLPGAFAVPGLHDAHLHVSGVGRLAEQVRLEGAASLDEALDRIREWAAAHPEAQVIRGRGWDQTRWPGAAFPTAADLDGLDPRPMALRRVDGHAVWVNRAMLRLAGIGPDTPDPEGGRIHRDAAGDPTGILVDNAMDLLDAVLPEPTDAERERWLLAGLEILADAGLAAVHDMGEPPAVANIAERLAHEGRLPIRLFVYLEGAHPGSLEVLGLYPRHERFTVMGVKFYADGALGSRGAALLDDYSDEPGRRGLFVTEPDELARLVANVHRRGYQCAVHAIGDAGVRAALDAVRRAQAGDPSRRHRIEHAQVVHPDDFAAFADLGVIASMQPTHCTSDMDWAEARLGPDRVRGAYAWRTMLDHGVPLACGSDAPVEHWNPLAGVYAAVTRQDADGDPPGGWLPDQRLTVDEALASFTAGAAFAVGRESDLGRLMPGMLCDLTVLDRDPRGAGPRAWLEAAPTALLVGGERIR